MLYISVLLSVQALTIAKSRRYTTTCGLTNSELNALYYLLAKRCVSEKHSVRYEVIEDALSDRIEDVEAVLAGLMKKGYVGRKKKKSFNYWIVLGPSLRALASHDYRIPRGGRIEL